MILPFFQEFLTYSLKNIVGLFKSKFGLDFITDKIVNFKNHQPTCNTVICTKQIFA
jgi:hypothetical protein